MTASTTGSTTTNCNCDSATKPTTGDIVTNAPIYTTAESTTVDTVANTTTDEMWCMTRHIGCPPERCPIR